MIALTLITAMVLSVVAWIWLTRTICRRMKLSSKISIGLIWLIAIFGVFFDTLLGIPYASTVCNKIGGYRVLSHKTPKGIYIQNPLPFQSGPKIRFQILGKPEAYSFEPELLDIFRFLFSSHNFIETQYNGQLVRWKANQQQSDCGAQLNAGPNKINHAAFIRQCLIQEPVEAITAEARVVYRSQAFFLLPSIETLSLESDQQQFSSWTWVDHRNRSLFPLIDGFIYAATSDPSYDCKPKSDGRDIIMAMLTPNSTLSPTLTLN